MKNGKKKKKKEKRKNEMKMNSKRYEADLNPFKKFKNSEKDSQYRQLNGIEKIVLQISKMFLG